MVGTSQPDSAPAIMWSFQPVEGKGRGGAYLERILPREALLTMTAREGLDRQVNPLMPLQVVIAVEALRTLIALERPVVLLWLL